MQYFTITVVNNTLFNQSISFFQAAAIYTTLPGKENLTVQVNSLYSEKLAPATKGASLNFISHLRFYAGAQEAAAPKPVEGQISAFNSISRLIDISGAIDEAGKPSPNATTLSVSPLALSLPVVNPAVTLGAFRITTLSAQDLLTGYNVGLVVAINGTEIMSSYVTVQTQQDIDCAPVLKFYVVVGDYAQGAPIDINRVLSNAAVCDFTSGCSRAFVTLNPVDPSAAQTTWSVKMSL